MIPRYWKSLGPKPLQVEQYFLGTPRPQWIKPPKPILLWRNGPYLSLGLIAEVSKGLLQRMSEVTMS